MASAKTRRPAATRRACLEAAVLHDETKILEKAAGAEAHVGVWEAILPIEESLRRLGHRVRRISLGGGIDRAIQALQKSRPDVVFHLAETAFGDTVGEARIASLLELMNLPHTSASADAILLCRDKLKTKAVLRERGFLTPAHAVSFDGRLPDRLPVPPWISKPTLEDGSIGITADAVTADPMRLRRRVRKLFHILRQPILIESFVAGREFNVGVVGTDILPLAEIDFSTLPAGISKIVNYESKWKYETVYFKGTKTLCPAPVSRPTERRLLQTGRDAVEALNVRGYARVDLRMDARGQIFILEINPNPDLSPIAAMAKMADTAGWGFDGLIARIIDFCLKRVSTPKLS